MTSLKNFILAGAGIISSLSCFAQEPAFGVFSPSDISLKECGFDKTAEAVIIFDKAVSNYDDNYKLVTERRIRFKILKEKGIERANVKIPFYHRNNAEFIARVKAVVGTPGEGGLTMQQLDAKSVYTRKVNDYYSEVSFALPNVKVGSIIDYSYESVMEHYGYLQDWYFQSDLPVMLSSYNLFIVPNAEFSYLVKKSKNIPIKIQPDAGSGSILFEMTNVPGLRDEAYSTSYRDYLQRVDFQLSALVRNGNVMRFTKSWKDMTKEFLDQKEFGGQLNKSLSGTADLKAALALLSTPYEKMNTIYRYVCGNFQWNRMISRYSTNGLKEVMEKKKGTSGDLNLLLVNLLRDADITAYPLLVSERSHGKVDTAFCFTDQFNKVVAYAEMDGRYYIMDATDPYTPVNMIPSELLNTTGYIIDKKQSRFVNISDAARKSSYLVSMKGSINKDKTVQAAASFSFRDYARIGRPQQYLSDKGGYLEKLLRPSQDIKVDSFSVENLDVDSVPLTHHLSFFRPLNQSGGYYMFHYNFFTGLDQSPFVSENRFTNIDFGTKFNYNLIAYFTIPDNMEIESLPKDMRLVIPGNHFVALREIKKQGAELVIRIQLERNQSEFDASDYQIIKEYYRKMVDLLNEPVLLKEKS